MVEKECPGCYVMQPIEEFPWKNRALGKRNSRCKTCFRARGKRWYAANREKQISAVGKRNKRYLEAGQQFIIDFLLQNPCIDCGETDIVVLQFDHVNGGDKIANVTEILRVISGNLEKLISEIDKCEVVCSNCHDRRTAQRANTYRWRYTQQNIKMGVFRSSSR